MKDIIRGSGIIFGFKILGAVSLFLVHLIIGRELGAEALGAFSLIFAIMMISAIGAKVGLDVYVVRVLPQISNAPEKIGGFLARSISIIFLSSVLVSCIILLLTPLLNQYLFKNIDAVSYLLWLAVLIFPITVFNVAPEVFRGLGSIKKYSFFRNVAQNLFLLVLISTCIFLIRENLDPVWALYVVTVSVALLAVVYLYGFLRRLGVSTFNPALYKENILKYSYPMMMTSSMMVLMGYVDSFIVSIYMDEMHVGIYNACIKLSIAITFVLASINGYIAPSISRAYSVGNLAQVNRIYWDSVTIVAVTVIPVAVAYYIFPQFFLGLFGEEFLIAEDAFLVVTTAFLVSALFGPIGYVMNMTDNQKYVMHVVFCSMVVNVGLNIWLVPQYGLLGASIAFLMSQIGWNASLFIRGKRLGLI